ncbi:hypothetical protein JCM6882_001113 [Rhodosporidiobolus microsporus]
MKCSIVLVLFVVVGACSATPAVYKRQVTAAATGVSASSQGLTTASTVLPTSNGSVVATLGASSAPLGTQTAFELAETSLETSTISSSLLSLLYPGGTRPFLPSSTASGNVSILPVQTSATSFVSSLSWAVSASAIPVETTSSVGFTPTSSAFPTIGTATPAFTTTPESESISGSDPAQLDAFLSGDGGDGNGDLSGLGSGISAATENGPGDFNNSIFFPSDFLGQLGLSQAEIAQAQAQQAQQTQQGGGGGVGGSTGGSSPSLEWPPELDSLGSTDSTPASDTVPIAGTEATPTA